MSRLRATNLDDGGYGDAPLQAAADDVVLGGPFAGDAFQRHVGPSAGRGQLADQLGVSYKTAWLLTQKLRRTMVDPNRDLLEGVVEVDQTEIPFRVGATFFEPGNAGKILIAGAVEVIERDTHKAKPRGQGAKYLDTRSGRLRLAAIDDNSAASIETFVRANVKPGSTLITDGHASYPGLAGANFPDRGGATTRASSAPWRPMSSCHGATAPSR